MQEATGLPVPLSYKKPGQAIVPLGLNIDLGLGAEALLISLPFLAY